MVTVDKLKKAVKGDIEVLTEEQGLSIIRINNKKLLKKLAWQLKGEFDILYSLTVVDYSPSFELNYVFSNYSNADLFIIKVNIDEKDFSVDSLVDIFNSAKDRKAQHKLGRTLTLSWRHIFCLPSL